VPGRARHDRTRRVRRRSEFNVLMKSGCRSRDGLFSIYVGVSDALHARLGVTVSKRVSPKAVARNRIKRQIRESFRHHQDLLAGLSLVVTAHAPADQRSNVQLRASLKQHWTRVTQACKKSRLDS